MKSAPVDWLPPVAIFVGALLLWEILVRVFAIPHYVLPGPLLIAETFWTDAPLLLGSLLVTLRITLIALVLAAVGGALMAFVMSWARWLERSLLPWAAD